MPVATHFARRSPTSGKLMNINGVSFGFSFTLKLLFHVIAKKVIARQTQTPPEA